MDVSTKTLLPSVSADGKETSLIRLDENGSVKSVIKRVWLSEKEGHMYTAKNGKWTITGEGYRCINRFANLFEIKKEKIVIDNKEISNPYIVFDAKGKKSKMIETVAVGGRSPSGEFHITEATIIMDVNETFVKSLLYKIKTDSKIGELVPNCLIDTDRKGYVYYPIDENVSVALNLSDKAAFDLYLNQLNAIEFADRKVHTLAWRNAIKAHPAVGKSILTPVDKNGTKVAFVDVVMWVDNFTDAELKTIEDYKINGKLDASSVESLVDNNEDPTDMDPEEEYGIVQEQETQSHDEKTDVINYIEESKNVIGEDAFKTVISEFSNLDEWHSLPLGTLNVIQIKINKIADNMEG